MNNETKVLQLLRDPLEFFDHSGETANTMPRDEIESVQLGGLRHRFEELRNRLAVLKAAADEQGITRINEINDGTRLLFPHTIYKSYPVSLLEKHQFARLTRWLSGLTTIDLSELDVSGCDSIDSWLGVLEEKAGALVAHSSGTGGTMSFLPRSARECRMKGEAFAMTSKDFNKLPFDLDLENNPYHVIFLGFRGGFSEAGRAASWYRDYFAGSHEYFYPLYDMDMSSDVMFVAARVRLMEARGELERLEVSPQLRAQQSKFEEAQKNNKQAIDRIFEKCISLKGEPRVYIGGMQATVYDIARRGLELGYRNLFGPQCIVQVGGGAKGAAMPDDWDAQVMEFTGARGIVQTYGMTELTMISAKCSEGNFHIPPWVIVYVLDPDTGQPKDRKGVQTGRAAFFDLAAETYWGGFATGDEVIAHWDPCQCGRTTVYLESKIHRFSEKRGGDDKINCAAADDAHTAALNFLAGP